MDVANIEKNAFSLGKKCSDVLAEIRLFRKKQEKFYGYEGPMVKRTHTLKEDAKDLNDLADFYEEDEFVEEVKDRLEFVCHLFFRLKNEMCSDMEKEKCHCPKV
jgi:hypothetical protein